MSTDIVAPAEAGTVAPEQNQGLTCLIGRSGGTESPWPANDLAEVRQSEGPNETAATPNECRTFQPGTLGHLIACYRTDPISGYQGVRHQTRQNYDRLLRRLERERGDTRLAETKLRDILVWYAGWSAGGTKLAMGHQMVGMLRTLFGFGLKFLECDECTRLSIVLHKEKFKQGKGRSDHLPSSHVVSIIERAHFVGMHSIGMAQAFQFECIFRQKDIIGEEVPETEPGESDIRRIDKKRGHLKWLRGIRWEEIGADLVLRHITSKKQKPIEVDLKNAPLVVAELQRIDPGSIWFDEAGAVHVDRSRLPAKGPIIRWEVTGRPYNAAAFRREWRMIADAVGVPKSIKNMDSRAGAITEATTAGAPIEHVKHAATHSDISQTQHYARGTTEKIASVQKARNAHRAATVHARAEP
jgi:hypothetical protein